MESYMNTFDAQSHTYSIAGRPVSGVTRVINTVLPGAVWKADRYYLDKGSAVHACAALIAKGKQFEHDPTISGQVASCRLFFAEIKPTVLSVEQQVYQETYGYAGTYDLHAIIQDKSVLVDWKSSASPVAEIQLGAYALAMPHPQPTWGMVVELHEDGKYKTGGMVKLVRRGQEFLSCLSVFNLRVRLGLIETKEASNGNG